jgi:ABC-type branched-subunit amino acid transport system substrate-binding protein
MSGLVRGATMNRRLFMMGSTAGSVALLLAGCSPTIGGTSVTANTAAGAALPVSGQTLGTGAVRIALLVPASATGNAGAIASSLRNAADLALREAPGSNLQILVKDDKGTPEGARVAASEAISEGAGLILGPLFSQNVSAAASVAKPAGVPIVAFSTDTNVASRNVYLLSFLPQTDVERIIGFAGSRGKHSIAALLPANGYGAVVEAALQTLVAVNGSRIIAIERYSLDRVSMQQKAEAVATLLQAGQVDSLFMPDAGDAAPFLAQILSAKGIRPGQVQILGSGQWDDPRIAAEPNLRGAWYPAPDKSGFSAFAARYQTAFGTPPLRAASLAYDATSLASGLSTRFGEQRFAAENLANPSGFIGIDGAFRFLPNGTNQRGLAVYEVGSGTVNVIDPAPKTFSRPTV